MRDPFKGSSWPLIASLSLFFGVAVWHWGWDIEVIDYGPPNATHFDVKAAPTGAEIHLCFDQASWRRVCTSRFVQHVTCVMVDPENPEKTITSRLDLEAHQIDAPPSAGPLPPKCRRFVVPKECLPGRMKLSSFAESACPPFGDWNKRYAYPPEIELQVLPRKQSD